jgi:hypothetical protein
MKTRKNAARVEASLQRRVRVYYEHLKEGDAEWCYRALDPSLRASPSAVTFHQYAMSLDRFLAWCGDVSVKQIGPIDLHLGEANRLYQDRDFALLPVVWEDRSGQEHVFRDRWVREPNGRWFTRTTGFLTPQPEETNEPPGD